MKLFIKERGASVKAQIQWEATTNVAKIHTTPFVWKFLLLNFFLYPQTWHSVSLCKFTFQIKAEKVALSFCTFWILCIFKNQKKKTIKRFGKKIALRQHKPAALHNDKTMKHWSDHKANLSCNHSAGPDLCVQNIWVKNPGFMCAGLKLFSRFFGSTWNHERLHRCLLFFN